MASSRRLLNSWVRISSWRDSRRFSTPAPPGQAINRAEATDSLGRTSKASAALDIEREQIEALERELQGYRRLAAELTDIKRRLQARPVLAEGSAH